MQDKLNMTGLLAIKKSSTPGKNRTCDAWLRSPSFFPLNYRGLAGDAGIDPATSELTVRHSTI